MKAIILAAGRGSRMKNLTDDLPKCLLEIGGVTLLEKQIASLRAAGIQDISIVGGYKISSLEQYNCTLYCNEDWSRTNMVFSLMKALDVLLSDDCIVSYGDIFYTADIVQSLISSTGSLSVAYDVNWLSLWQKRFENVLDDAETFKKDNCNNIIEIGNRPSSIEEIEGQYMGLLKFRKEFWTKQKDFVQTLDSNISMTRFLQLLIDKGVPIQAVANNMPWGEADNPEDIKVYN